MHFHRGILSTSAVAALLLATLAPTALASTSSAQLWTALERKITCGVAIHQANSPPMQLLCSAKPVPAPKGKGIGLRRHKAGGAQQRAQVGHRPDQRDLHDQLASGSLCEPLASRLHDHQDLLPRVLRHRGVARWEPRSEPARTRRPKPGYSDLGGLRGDRDVKFRSWHSHGPNKRKQRYQPDLAWHDHDEQCNDSRLSRPRLATPAGSVDLAREEVLDQGDHVNQRDVALLSDAAG